MAKVLIPPQIVKLTEPSIFLAGPIQGAPDWQAEAIKIIHSLNPKIIIASPRRQYLDGEFVYEDQVDWETSHLRQAAHNGVILFWLAQEAEHFPERSYAQTSRFELGEWKIKHQKQGVKLVIGIENGFSNARYIKRRFAQDCPKLKIYQSLGATCREAVGQLE